MTSPLLNLPPLPGRRLRLLPAGLIRISLRHWLRRACAAPGNAGLEHCLRKLSHDNRRYYSVRQRLAILETLQLALYENFTNERDTLDAGEHVSPSGPKRAQILAELLDEFIYGYKLLLHSLTERGSLDEAAAMQIQEVIYFILKFMSQRIAFAYSQYAAIPKGMWRELHQIFHYAEQHDLLIHIIDDPAPDTSFPVFHTGDFVYKRLILLALAEPYHLMQGECLQLYNLCSRWANEISTTALAAAPPQGQHIVDMADDRPPRFVAADLDWQPRDGRIIHMQEALQKMERDLELAGQAARPGQDLALSLLHAPEQRALLQRVLPIYRGKPVRACKRFNLQGQIVFAPGLDACHHYLMDNATYTPELDELELRSSQMERQSRDIDPLIFSRQYEQALAKDQQRHTGDFQLEHALQRDVNPLGLALVYRPPSQQEVLQVGELIAHRSGSKKHARWQIGMANWMHRVDDSGEQAVYQIGVQNLAKRAIPVAIKYRGKRVQDPDYCRGILIPKDNSYNQTRSLLLPPAHYDVDTAVTVNMQKKLFHARLKRVLLDTRSFTQFEFDILP